MVNAHAQFLIHSHPPFLQVAIVVDCVATAAAVGAPLFEHQNQLEREHAIVYSVNIMYIICIKFCKILKKNKEVKINFVHNFLNSRITQ